MDASVNVKDFGAKGDGTTDDSACFQAALETLRRVVVPEGTYCVCDLAPPRHARLDCESRNVVIKGVTREASIFRTTKARTGIHISGGRWEQCKSVWSHISESSLNACLFENMAIARCEVGFDLSSSVGNVWRGITMTTLSGCEPYGYGWKLGGDHNSVNANRWVDCNVLGYSKGGVYFRCNLQPKRGNVIRSCWFEDAPVPAIFAAQGVSHLVISQCYFENTGCAESPDILLDKLQRDPSNSIKPMVIVADCHFAKWARGQQTRIQTRGHVNLIAKDNTVHLPGGRRPFVTVDDVPNDHPIQLVNNLLDVGGSSASYQVKLFSKTGLQKVVWGEHWIDLQSA